MIRQQSARHYRRAGGLAVLLAMVVTACATPQTTGFGGLGLTVAFPAPAGFTVKDIPAATQRIAVTISGQGLDAPLHQVLTASSPSLNVTVPSGPKTIDVTAQSESGETLATGSAAAVVEPQKKTTATVILTPVPEPKPTPTPTPGQSPDPKVVRGPGDPPSEPPASPLSPTPVPGVTPLATPTPATVNVPGGGGGGGVIAPTPTPTPGVGGHTVTIDGATPSIVGSDV